MHLYKKQIRCRPCKAITTHTITFGPVEPDPVRSDNRAFDRQSVVEQCDVCGHRTGGTHRPNLVEAILGRTK